MFALELADAGRADADQLVPLTFLVVVGTVTLYGNAEAHAEQDRQIDARRRARWWDLGTPLKKAWQARPLS